jgi:hypothetical protein
MTAHIKTIWQFYLHYLDQHPIKTKAISSAVTNVIGDIIAQEIAGNKKLDVMRTVKFGSFGLIVTGPLVHFWYKLLNQVFSRFPTTPLTVVIKIALHQLVFTPALFVLFWTWIAMFEGTVHKLKSQISNNMLRMVVAQLKIWPLAQYINFRYVPLNLQVLFSNLVALVWNIYFSLLNASGKKLK